MTTPQPAALPELPEKLIFSERLAISEAAQVPMDAECCRVIQATLDYISSNYALAALQPQPAAAVSDEELLTAYNSIDPCNESPTDRLIRRLRAILALRPQAVPMTPEQVRALVVECGYDHASMQERADFINGVRTGERWHRITAQGAQGEQG